MYMSHVLAKGGLMHLCDLWNTSSYHESLNHAEWLSGL